MKFFGSLALILLCASVSVTGGFIGGIAAALYLMNV